MIKNNKPLLETLNGQGTNYVPVWLMRQAGRYLPEYRALRSQAGNFLDLCLTPKLAAEITLQPIERFGFDGAILFADILLVPMALGQRLEFREGEGPALEALENEEDFFKLALDMGKLSPVLETLGRVKARLDDKTVLIGFCGAPWTVACYMIDGTSKNGFIKAKQWAKERPEWLEKLTGILLNASEKYLSEQIEAGAEVLQIFDSWAGLLQGSDFERWIIRPTQDLIKRIKKKYPHIPVIGFPREAGAMYGSYAEKTGVDAMSVDQHVSLDELIKLQKVKLLQGNLDPALLVKGGDEMRAAVEKILETLGPHHVFNLGHGVVPETPLQHVGELVNLIRNRNKF